MTITPDAVVHAAAEALTLGELAAAAAPPLKRLVGIDGVTLYRHGGDGRIDGIGGDLATILGEYLPEHVKDDPTHARARRLAPRPRVVLATSLLAPGALRRSAAWADFYRKNGIERIACLWLTDVPYGAPGMTGLLLSRPASRDDFTVGDKALLDAVLPSLSIAVRRCRRLQALAPRPIVDPRDRDEPDAHSARPDALRVRHGLTPAEAKVLRLLALGLSNAAIAERTACAVETVRTHVKRVFDKLRVGTRAQAAVMVWAEESAG
jgi:DNA-binding CsgD family transcriptional regulator